MLKTLILKNWKGLNRTIELARLSFVTGSNFSGKTGIAEAIRALALGYSPEASSKKPTSLKEFASGFPMAISGAFENPDEFASIQFTLLKGKEKLSVHSPLSGLDEAGKLLFDPSLFFGLSDAQRIAKAVELVTSEGVKTEDVTAAINTAVEGVQDEIISSFVDEWASKAPDPSVSVNEFIDRAGEFWKACRKNLAEEKTRMVKTLEGLTDIGCESLEGHTKETIQAEIDQSRRAHNALAERITNAKRAGESIERNTAIALRCRKLIEAANEAKPEIERLETEAAALRNFADALRKEQEDLKAKISLHVLANVNASKIRRADEAEKSLPGLRAKHEEATAFQSELRAKVEGLEAKRQPVMDEVRQLNADLYAVRNPEPVQQADFIDNAKHGKEYTVQARVVFDGNEIHCLKVTSWSEESDNDEDAINLEFSIQQDLQEKHQIIEEITSEIYSIHADLRHQNDVVHGLDRRVSDAESDCVLDGVAQTDGLLSDEQLSAAKERNTDLAGMISEKTGGLQSVESSLKSLRDVVSRGEQAEDSFPKDEAYSDSPDKIPEMEAELREVDAKGQRFVEKLTLAVKAEMLDDQRNTANARLGEVKDAHATVSEILKAIDEKRVELLSGSIGAALGVANRVASGILKGELVFEEGKIGMRIDEQFIPRLFSGTEAAVIVMGLTVGLARNSRYRIAILDEVGRLDESNALKLADNLALLIDEKVIDQAIMIGPENPALISDATIATIRT